MQGKLETKDQELVQQQKTPKTVVSPEAKERVDTRATDTKDDAIGTVNGDAERLQKSIVIEKVKSPAELAKWLVVFKEIFTDEGDREPDETLYETLNHPEEATFFTIMDGEKPVGVMMSKFSQDKQAMYIPYGGLAEGYKSLGIYPQVRLCVEEQVKKQGVKFVLADCEDADRLDNLSKAYPDEAPEQVKDRADRRIAFFRRELDAIDVRDPRVPYMRPASDDPKKIQAYDRLLFKPLANFDGYNSDKTAITKESYRAFYLQLMRIECGNEPEETLRAEYPAIEKFLSTLDKLEDNWVRVEATPMARKPRNADVNVRMAA